MKGEPGESRNDLINGTGLVVRDVSGLGQTPPVLMCLCVKLTAYITSGGILSRLIHKGCREMFVK